MLANFYKLNMNIVKYVKLFSLESFLYDKEVNCLENLLWIILKLVLCFLKSKI